MTADRKSGIFAIRNIATGKMLIGRSYDLRIAKNKHFRDLRKGNRTNRFLQEDFDLWEEENFEFEVVEYCDPEKLQERKDYYIDFYANINGSELYNMDVIEKLRKAYTGSKLSEERKEKIRLSGMGKRLSEETRKKISLSHTGMKYSEEFRRKVSNRRKGVKLSEEHRKKISRTMRGIYERKTSY